MDKDKKNELLLNFIQSELFEKTLVTVYPGRVMSHLNMM